MTVEGLCKSIGRLVCLDFASQTARFCIDHPDERHNGFFTSDLHPRIQVKVQHHISVHGIPSQNAGLVGGWIVFQTEYGDPEILPFPFIQLPDLCTDLMFGFFVFFALSARGESVVIGCFVLGCAWGRTSSRVGFLCLRRHSFRCRFGRCGSRWRGGRRGKC